MSVLYKYILHIMQYKYRCSTDVVLACRAYIYIKTMLLHDNSSHLFPLIDQVVLHYILRVFVKENEQ